MQGADAVLDFNFPNPLGVMSNTLVANGVNVPHVDGASASIIAGAKVVQGPAATNLNGVGRLRPGGQHQQAGHEVGQRLHRQVRVRRRSTRRPRPTTW